MSSKHYFKHRYGYIHIDEDNLYFTDSGNWSEARRLKEKPGRKPANEVKWWNRVLGYVLIAILIGLSVFMFYDILTSEIKLGSICFTGFITCLLGYKQIMEKYGPRIRIPREKITSITLLDNGVLEVQFLDDRNDKAVQLIKLKREVFREMEEHLQFVTNQ